MNNDFEKQMSYDFISDFFVTIRRYSAQKNLTLNQSRSLKQQAQLMLQSFMGNIYPRLEDEEQVAVANRIQREFVLVLQDYDRQWVWDLLNDFTGILPDELQN